jgi:mono/diheme cytochrome c family protein
MGGGTHDSLTLEQHMTGARGLALGFLFLGTTLIAGGCKKSDNSTPNPGPSAQAGPPTGVAETGPHAAGKRAFNSNGCVNCHSIGGGAAAATSGKGRMKGPDLAIVARDPEHTPEWLTEYIRNPKSKKTESRMPPQSRISDDDLRSVVEYLSSLK